MTSNTPARLPKDRPGIDAVCARAPKQERSAQRQQRIADAAIAAIAKSGIAGVTHRQVAREAGVSLAATTYYYQTKSDIIADAANQLLTAYVNAFRRFLERQPDKPGLTFRDFAMKLIINAAGKHRTGTLAWCEIILDAARHPETRTLARAWFARLGDVWLEIATAFGVPSERDAVRSAVDIVIGLLFVVVPLGLSEHQVAAVLDGGADPAEAWRPTGEAAAEEARPIRTGRKAEETRERILAAAIGILSAEGSAALTYRAVAARAGLTPAAPTYHFPSIDLLLEAAQARLFEAAKDRYREIMAGVDYGGLDVERLTDLTTAVFLREATEFGALNLASMPIWLESGRDPHLRSTIWNAVDDQNRAWSRLLAELAPGRRPLDALLLHRLFLGKLTRILATGAATTDLASVRSEFAYDLRAICAGQHWAQRQQ